VPRRQAFQGQQYPEAVKHYTEALARGPPDVNPEAHKLFSNRAACYTKLGAWSDGVKDADECIRLAPTFTKGYRRAAGAPPDWRVQRGRACSFVCGSRLGIALLVIGRIALND